MYAFVKRLTDIVVGVLLLFVLSPCYLILAILVRLTSEGPTIFKQSRIGRDGRVFTILKFRTMVEHAERQGSGIFSYEEDPRVTRVGRILRKTSLDELPQLINIVKGEMSFIGPRPPVTYYPYTWEEYTEEQRLRFRVRPGVTGLAQINGRKRLNWEERIQLDLYYIKHMSLSLDLRILIQTVKKVVQMDDNTNEKQSGDS